MDSSQLCQKHAEERPEQPFAPYPGVVHELEEPKVQRELFLGDATMGAQPFDPLRRSSGQASTRSGLKTAKPFDTLRTQKPSMVLTCTS